MADVVAGKLAALREKGVRETVVAKLQRFLHEARDVSLYRISPYRLADEWKLPRGDVLNGFLFGTREGLFDLEWSVRCRSCRQGLSIGDHLAGLHDRAHCDFCGVNTTTTLDEAVEVTFRVNQNIRSLPVADQRAVAEENLVLEGIHRFNFQPKGARKIRVRLRAGTYLFTPPDPTMTIPLAVHHAPTREGAATRDAGRPQRVNVYVSIDGIRRDAGEYSQGDFEFLIRNLDEMEVTVQFARSREFPWVSGADVANNQNFRDLFATEIIAPDEQFSVKSTTFVFTDIKGSTAMYERLGDARAYFLVKEHFKILREVVASHGGAIVKTIGDAIMATFLAGDSAVAAVLEMHRRFRSFNTNELRLHDVLIKVGVHDGPSLAVTSNDRLDYFGQTVNIAARIQSLADGDETVISRHLGDDPRVHELLLRAGCRTRAFTANLKGVSAAFEVLQVLEV